MNRLLFIGLVVGAAPAFAQFPSQVHAGVRVRVWVPEQYSQDNNPWRRQLLRGTVSSLDGDALRLGIPGATGEVVIPRSSIRRLDVSRGQSRVASAIERAIGGAIVGAIGAALENDPGSTEWPAYNRDWRAAEEGAKWGAALGASIGFVFPTERWRRVRLRR